VLLALDAGTKRLAALVLGANSRAVIAFGLRFVAQLGEFCEVCFQVQCSCTAMPDTTAKLHSARVRSSWSRRSTIRGLFCSSAEALARAFLGENPASI